MNRTGNEVLSLLAFPLNDTLLGDACVYDLSDSVREAWTDLRDRYRDQSGSQANLPYAGLATALRAAGRTSVNFHHATKQAPPSRMITRTRLDPEDLRDAVTIWEQALLNVSAEDIRLSYPSKLADLIADIEPRHVRLFDEIPRRGQQPDPPRWVYDVATWEAAQRLAGTPLAVDNRSIDLRADTSGDLTVWDNDQLWTGHWSQRTHELHYACLRVGLSMETLPGMTLPALVLDPSVSRLSRWLASSRRVWLSQHDPTAPLLALDMDGKGKGTRIERTSDLALTVWSRLRGEPALLPDDRDLSGPPGRLRALIPKSVRSPIGRGVGLVTIRALSSWGSQALSTDPVMARNVAGHRFKARQSREAGRDAALLDPAALPGIIDASGAQRLRIVALYQHEHTRARVCRMLAHHFARPDLAQTLVKDGLPIDIAPQVEAVFQKAAELLKHGENHHRAQCVEAIGALRAEADTRVLALCETEFNAEAWDEQRRRSREKGSDAVDPYAIDAKPQVNRLLAAEGVPSQFLATRSPAEAVEVDATASAEERLAAEVKDDHSGHNAIADLLRSAGLIHHRLGTALAFGPLGISEPVAHVGLHVRQQNAPNRGTDQRLSWTLAALIPLEDGRWRSLAYRPPSQEDGGGWKDYAATNAAMRARPIPSGRRQAPEFPKAIEAALTQLTRHTHNTAGYVLYVSGDSTRGIWPLLANRNLDQVMGPNGEVDGRIALPGSSLPLRQRPRAVVRVSSSGDSRLPRPVHALETKIKNGEPTTQQTKAPSGLYQLDDAADTWILSNVPKQFKGGGRTSRIGEKYSRWSAKNQSEVKLTWYSLTTTEITVVRCDGDALRYAVAAARLCDHAISWDGRTRYPAPIHLAARLDLDHPEYRRTAEEDGGYADSA